MGACAATHGDGPPGGLEQGDSQRCTACSSSRSPCALRREYSGEDGEDHATAFVDGAEGCVTVAAAAAAATVAAAGSSLNGCAEGGCNGDTPIGSNPTRVSPELHRTESRNNSKSFVSGVSGKDAKAFASGVGQVIAQGIENLVSTFGTVSPTSAAVSKREDLTSQSRVQIDATQPAIIDNTTAQADEDNMGGTEEPEVPEGEEAEEDEVEDQKMKLLRAMMRKPSMALKIIIENPRDITACYRVETKDLGKGAFGCVRKARVKATGAVRAVKFVLKSRMKGKEFFLQNEIEILKSVDHPNIIKLYELFEDIEQIYMVMELCSGGALIDHLKRAGRFTEKEAAKSMVQIMRAIYYLHDNDIAHRDMKPANCLIVTRDVVEKSSLRVTDFGLSCRCTKDQVLTDRVGTPAFMSPQVISRKYDRSCDTWSCGVTMFMLLSGKTPFPGKTDEEIRSKVTAGNFSFDPNVWLDVSEDGMNLIRRLLRVNVKQRCTVQEALRCEWLRKKALEAEPQPSMDLTILQNLTGFRALNKFKRAALCIIASMLDEEQTKDARDLFVFLDTDDDGLLQYDELRNRLQLLQVGDETIDIASFIPEADPDEPEPPPYPYTEFLAATFDRSAFCQRGVCWAAFNAFDADSDGSISQQELVKGWVLGELTEDELQKLVRDFDADGDGTIDFQEFMEMMRDGEGWTPSLRSPRSPSSSRPSSKCDSPRRFFSGDSRERDRFQRSTSPMNGDAKFARGVSGDSNSKLRRQGSGAGVGAGGVGAGTPRINVRRGSLGSAGSNSPRERSPRSPGKKTVWRSEDEVPKDLTPKSIGSAAAKGATSPKSRDRSASDGTTPLSPKASAKSGPKQPVGKTNPIAGVLLSSEESAYSTLSQRSPVATSPRSKSAKAAGGAKSAEKKGRLSFLQAIRG